MPSLRHRRRSCSCSSSVRTLEQPGHRSARAPGTALDQLAPLPGQGHPHEPLVLLRPLAHDQARASPALPPPTSGWRRCAAAWPPARPGRAGPGGTGPPGRRTGWWSGAGRPGRRCSARRNGVRRAHEGDEGVERPDFPLRRPDSASAYFDIEIIGRHGPFCQGSTSPLPAQEESTDGGGKVAGRHHHRRMVAPGQGSVLSIRKGGGKSLGAGVKERLTLAADHDQRGRRGRSPAVGRQGLAGLRSRQDRQVVANGMAPWRPSSTSRA